MRKTERERPAKETELRPSAGLSEPEWGWLKVTASDFITFCFEAQHFSLEQLQEIS
jgi:hypothetical protein